MNIYSIVAKETEIPSDAVAILKTSCGYGLFSKHERKRYENVLVELPIFFSTGLSTWSLTEQLIYYHPLPTSQWSEEDIECANRLSKRTNALLSLSEIKRIYSFAYSRGLPSLHLVRKANTDSFVEITTIRIWVMLIILVHQTPHFIPLTTRQDSCPCAPRNQLPLAKSYTFRIW
jgi:hypothetical protein